MAKVMNVVFGIGIAVLIFIVVLLGIKAFYPGPTYDDYDCTYPEPARIAPVCAENMTVKECNTLQNSYFDSNSPEMKSYEECNKKFQEADKKYRTVLFFVVYIIGIICLIISMYLLNMTNIAAGIAFAGLALIFYGFGQSWGTTNDIMKFITGLVAAVVVIVFAVVLNKKYSK